jgi:hypothetical protein
MCHPQGLRLIQEFSETLMIVAKDKTPKKGLTRRRPKKGVVPIFRDIDPHDQILLRMPYLLPQLTKFLQSVTIYLIHKKPPAQEF